MTLQNLGWPVWLRGLVLAGPIVFFPLSRAYYLFYLLILITGLSRAGLGSLWRQHAGLRLALLAFALPILITLLAHLLSGAGLEKVWLEKLAVFTLAGLMGLGAAGLAREPGTARAAQLLIVLAILSWMADGTWQLLTGSSISGQALALGNRLTAYFSHPMKFGFFIGVLALLPAFYLVPRRHGRLAATLLLALAAVLTMAGGSRYGLLAFLLGVACFALLQSLALPLRQRWALWLGGPLLAALALVASYQLIPALQSRVDQSAQLLEGISYDSVNKASSHRLDIWYPTVELAKDHWAFGVGPGSFTEAVKPYLGADNIYVQKGINIMHTHQVMLETWVATGIIGLLAFLAYYLWLARRLAATASSRASMGWGCLLVFALLWFPLGTQHNFYASEMVLLSFYLLGLGFGGLQPPPAVRAVPAQGA